MKIKSKDVLIKDTEEITEQDIIKADINDITKEEMKNPGFIPSLFANYRGEELDNVLSLVLDKAKSLRILTDVKKSIETYKKDNRALNSYVYNMLVVSAKGEPEPTIDNYYAVMSNDDNIKECFKYDEFADQYQYYDKYTKKIRPWKDSDDSFLISYIESTYGFCNELKYRHGFNKVMEEHKYHPLKNLLEEEEWDGVARIDRFLTDIMGCDDDVYSREVSRMIFYGGISRLYEPGCKFDYMPIFMGLQGLGKSTIVRWLALEDRFYREVTTIEGKEGMESIQGGWICEFAELLAMINSKSDASMKSFVSRTSDNYRKAYGKHVSYCPRECLFIGTTNDYQFLVDKTGQRRYLPIEINLQKGELFDNEQYVKDYILQCWREALYLYNNKKIYLSIPSKYENIIQEHREAAVEDDPKVGDILSYLDEKEDGYKVCAREIFVNCLSKLKNNYTSRDGREIGAIIKTVPCWIRVNNPIDFPEYGRQRYWIKDSNYQKKMKKINKRKVGDDL